MKLFKRKPMFVTTGYESPPTAPAPWLSGIATKLGSMSPRERQLVLGAALVLFLALLWLVAISPALNTLAKAPDQVRVLESELTVMRQQATEIESLRALPARNVPTDFAGTVQSRIKAALGDTARVTGTPAQVTLNIQNANAATLLTALQEVSDAAQARIESINLARNADGTTLRAEVKWVPRGTN